MFGKNKDNDSPLPKGMNLVPPSGQAGELLIDKLTQAAIREDLNVIRYKMIEFEKMAEHLQQITTGQAKVVQVVKELTKSQNQMIGLLRDWQEMRENSTQTSEAEEVIDDLKLRRIEDLLVKLTDRISSELANGADKSSETGNQEKLVVEKRGSDGGNQNYLRNADELQNAANDETAHPVQEWFEPLIEETANRSAPDDKHILIERNRNVARREDNEPALAVPMEDKHSLKICSKIISLLEGLIKADSRKFVRRDAEHLAGITSADCWIVALPGKSDGSYDASVLQNTAYGILADHRKSSETVIAVYDGAIKPKTLQGAKVVAEERKITLASLTDLEDVLKQERIV